MPLDRDRFIKLMQMTTSANDQEALVALRKANEMLRSIGKSWEQFCKERIIAPQQTSKPKVRYAASDRFTNAAVIDPLLDGLLQQYPNNPFVNSVNNFWERTGFITGKQFNALEELANQ